MNFLSAEGYSFYFKHFTDMEKVQQGIRKKMEDETRRLEDLQRSLEYWPYDDEVAVNTNMMS